MEDCVNLILESTIGFKSLCFGNGREEANPHNSGVGLCHLRISAACFANTNAVSLLLKGIALNFSELRPFLSHCATTRELPYRQAEVDLFFPRSPPPINARLKSFRTDKVFGENRRMLVILSILIHPVQAASVQTNNLQGSMSFQNGRVRWFS